MYPPGFVFGLLNRSNPFDDPSLSEKLRDLTISWSRYGYQGVILEGCHVNDILDEASRQGYRWCLIQAAGHILIERWLPENGPERRVENILTDFVKSESFLVVADKNQGDTSENGLDDRCLLVDLHRYDALGRPDFDASDKQPTGANFSRISRERDLPVYLLDEVINRQRLDFEVKTPLDAKRIADLFQNPALALRQDLSESIPESHRHFMKTIDLHLNNGRRGVFLWNLEPYDDIEAKPDHLQSPIQTLYSVAAGFKPNALLESLGFNEATRVVFFDYSRPALEARRTLLEEWSGSDYPSFIRTLFEKYPHPTTYYHLWRDSSPETADWPQIEARWRQELEWWGGEDAFRDHWSRYRKLRHEFIECDLLNHPEPTLERIASEDSAAIWWSNAFFTISSNWIYLADERQALYRRWIEGLAQRNPNLHLYGSDANNASVNNIRAAEYYQEFNRNPMNPLVPLQLNRCVIRS